ncbi:serine/Arginine-related protein 53 [Nycticebus coucang]|uniref:serine/Arginine-related protein 53 n=1 Tax=Nycticebus coucang TaxID=9470 RepID=UPI00234CB17F|nr:serine/Arginine-related protein 53 [Nycticebus coucang]
MLEFLLVVLAAAAAATTEAAEAESAANVASGSPKGGAGNIMYGACAARHLNQHPRPVSPSRLSNPRHQSPPLALDLAAGYLNSGLRQPQPLAQLLPHEGIRVVGLVKKPLQLVELFQAPGTLKEAPPTGHTCVHAHTNARARTHRHTHGQKQNSESRYRICLKPRETRAGCDPSSAARSRAPPAARPVNFPVRLPAVPGAGPPYGWKAGRGTAAGGQAVTLREPRAARLPASLGSAHVQLPDGRAPSSSSSARSSSGASSAAPASASSAAASAGRPDCRAAAVVAAGLGAAARLLGPAQRPALQHLPVIKMGRRSSDTEEESRSKRKKKHRRRSSSSSSSDSRTYSRKKGGRKSRSKSRSWSRDLQPRSHSYDRRRRHRSSSSSSYGSRRKRSRSRSRGRGKSYRVQRSRSKSRTRRSRSRPRPRSHSRSSERSSHRRTRSRSRDRERRKGRDKERREKEKDKGKDKELHNIRRGESGNIKAGLEHLPPAEQAKARLQLVLEAAAKADEALKAKERNEEEAKRRKEEDQATLVEQVKRVKEIEAIESDSFVQQTFRSSKEVKKSVEPSEVKQAASASVPASAVADSPSLEKEIDASSIPTAIKYQDDTSLAHPNLFIEKADAEEKWFKRLIALRQERLMGSPVA